MHDEINISQLKCHCKGSKQFGIPSLIIVWFFRKLQKRYERQNRDDRVILCRDVLILYLGGFLPGFTGGIHFLRRFFLFLTLLRIMHLMPPIGFPERWRQRCSDYIGMGIRKFRIFDSQLKNYK